MAFRSSEQRLTPPDRADEAEAGRISRIWHGWTAHRNADAYENLLKNEISPGLQAKGLPGCRGIQLYRRELDTKTEFVTIMWFNSLDAVKAFAGADYDVAVVPPKARKVLARYDPCSVHYEIRESLVPFQPPQAKLL